MFAIKDAKLNAFMQPFAMSTRGQAIRAFSDQVNDAGTFSSKHPEDFTLYEIAVYNDETAAMEYDDLVTKGNPVNLANGTDFVKKFSDQS